MTNTAVTGATYDIDGGQQLGRGEPVRDATLTSSAATMQCGGVVPAPAPVLLMINSKWHNRSTAEPDCNLAIPCASIWHRRVR
jgi:hypothetical protein